MTYRPNTSRILHRSLGSRYRTAASGQGCIIRDAEGKTYIDASGGAAVSCLGHGHARVADAMKRQIDRIAYAHTSFFTNDPAEELASHLAARAPGGRWRVFFTSGGSEATEAALKLARQMQVERGQGGRDHFFSRWFSYHGNTLGALSVSGNAARRKLYDPILVPNVRLVDPCFAYRWQREEESAEDYGARAARSLGEAVHSLGPGRGIAFIAETVVGATLGAAPPAPGYFAAVRRICDEHGLFMIADEVMCGMGRCGRLYAFEEEGIIPDMITLAKGLGAGYQPIGAVLVREDIVEELAGGSGAFQHGHTYVAHAVATAAALEVQKVIEDDGLVERAARSGQTLMRRLQKTFGDHPNVGDVRGRGLLWAIEIVADRRTKRPFPAERKLWSRIKSMALDEGLLCYPGGGTADGVDGDHVLVAPPYTISEDELDEAVSILGRVVDRALRS
jgi:adenosylmethionine-8-amino-7-oxononanoate aminotransferase